MVGLCPDLVSLQGFGTDGEMAIGDGFKLQFRSATHLLCFIHVKDCIVRKLREIGVCGSSAKSFLEDIFGKQDATHLFTGLVDCDSPDDFDEQLLKLETEWNAKECAIRSSTIPLFYDWFTKHEFQSSYIGIKAGLGDPPTTMLMKRRTQELKLKCTTKSLTSMFSVLK